MAKVEDFPQSATRGFCRRVLVKRRPARRAAKDDAWHSLEGGSRNNRQQFQLGNLAAADNSFFVRDVALSIHILLYKIASHLECW